MGENVKGDFRMGYRHKKEGALSLLPFLIFIVIYLGAGIYFQIHGVEMAFYQFPSVTAMFIAVLSAFFMGDETLQVKFGIFSRGAGNENVMTMLMIYILAGAFSAVAAAMGGRDATVNLGISFVPAQYLTAGIFIISAFMGTATGTSMGTIAAIVPIAAGISVKSGISEALMVAACVGGAMFGDNLSMISDTTIAATRTQGCELKDKFKMNFRIALPAAVLTIFFSLLSASRQRQLICRSLITACLKYFLILPFLDWRFLGQMYSSYSLQEYSLPDLSAWHRRSLRLLLSHRISGTALWGWEKPSSLLFSAAVFQK